MSYALGAGISVETLRTADPAATAAIDLTGNELANIVTGNAGANVINGGAGNDRLTGRAGGDRFVFDTALDAAANVDTITDFDVTQDKIGLDNSVFASLVKPGSLSTNAFRIGTASEDANDYIIYNDVTGALSYDADGSRAGDAIQFARLSAGLCADRFGLRRDLRFGDASDSGRRCPPHPHQPLLRHRRHQRAVAGEDQPAREAARARHVRASPASREATRRRGTADASTARGRGSPP